MKRWIPADFDFTREKNLHTQVFWPVLRGDLNVLNVVFLPLNVGVIELSRSIFVQFKNPSLISQFYVLGFFVNFWVYLEGDSFSQRIG